MPHIKGMIELDCDFDALAEDLERNGYVKVVRCKDCKHRPHIEKAIMWGRQEIEVCAPRIDEREDYSCMCLNPDNSYYSWMPDDNWFCADGERGGSR